MIMIVMLLVGTKPTIILHDHSFYKLAWQYKLVTQYCRETQSITGFQTTYSIITLHINFLKHLT